jgi:hypothetical protein
MALALLWGLPAKNIGLCRVALRPGGGAHCSIWPFIFLGHYFGPLLTEIRGAFSGASLIGIAHGLLLPRCVFASWTAFSLGVWALSSDAKTCFLQITEEELAMG